MKPVTYFKGNSTTCSIITFFKDLEKFYQVVYCDCVVKFSRILYSNSISLENTDFNSKQSLE